MGVAPDSPNREEVSQTYKPVADLFSAMASPIRAAILHQLSVDDRSVGDLVAVLGLPQPLVSQHLRTLRYAGLVAVERVGRSSMYRLADDHVAHIFLDAFQHSREESDQ